MQVKPLPREDMDHVLAHTRAIWPEARGCTFFITGGTGFFGMWILESFAHVNDELGLGMHATVLTRDPAAFALKAPHLAARSDLSFLRGDVRSFDYPGVGFDYIVHAATEASARLNQEDPAEMLDSIIGGARHVLGLAAQCGVKKLLLASSGAVYGKQPPDVAYVSEDFPGAPDPLSPSSAYGEGKRVSEHMCVVHARKYGYEAKIARCFAFVGPHLPLDGGFAVGNFVRDALSGGPVRIAGDGSPVRSYLYSADLAVWLWTLLFCGASGRACNVGSGEAMDLLSVARVVADMSGNGSMAVEVEKRSDPSLSASRYVPSVQTAAHELGLKPYISFADSIARTLRWHRA